MNQESKANPPNRSTNSGTFSIKGILVITTVLAATALSLSYLYQAANGNPAKIGQFVVVTAMLPMVILVGASWFFKILDRFIE